MRLYHTSDREIPRPDLARGRKNADFGQGFYLSPDREFAFRWAGADAVVNTVIGGRLGVFRAALRAPQSNLAAQ